MDNQVANSTCLVNSSGSLPNKTGICVDGLDRNNTGVISAPLLSPNFIEMFICLMICITGITSNALSVTVFTRKHMRTPTNFILLALAVVDLTFIVNLPFCVGLTVQAYNKAPFYCLPSQSLAEFQAVLESIFLTGYTMGSILTVSIAAVRFAIVCLHIPSRKVLDMKRAQITVAAAAVMSPLIMISRYVLIYVEDQGDDCWTVNFADNGFVAILKMTPTVVLTFFTIPIIFTLLKNRHERSVDLGVKSPHHKRTTMMLMAVVLFSIGTELPHGLLLLLQEYGLVHFYTGWGWVMGFLNKTVNMYFYLGMSRSFRDTFKDLFCTKCMQSSLPAVSNRSRSDGTGSSSGVQWQIKYMQTSQKAASSLRRTPDGNT